MPTSLTRRPCRRSPPTPTPDAFRPTSTRPVCDTALDLLTPQPGDPADGRGAALTLEARYYRLSEMIGNRREPGVAERIARARSAGVAPAESRDTCDPADMADLFDDPTGDPDAGADWWRRVPAAGARGDFALACPYPPRGDAAGYLPLDNRDRTGDVDARIQPAPARV